MHSLAYEVLKAYGRQFPARLQVLNEWAALKGGLLESNAGGQPYVALNALVLTPLEKERLAYLTGLFGQIMARALAAIVESGPAVYRKMGWPEGLDFSLRYETPNRYLTAIGRFDFGLEAKGIGSGSGNKSSNGSWQLFEYNSDTPSGPQEATLIETRLFKMLSRLKPLARLNPDVGLDMARALYQEALFAPLPAGNPHPETALLPPRVGFIVQARHLTDLAQVEYYAARLQEQGLECVVGDLLNLSLAGGELLLLGKPVDAIWRLHPLELMAHTPILAAILEANRAGILKCLNNLRGFLAQGKGIMAWLWQHKEDPLFTAEEQEALAAHLPETYLLPDLPEDFDYSRFIVKEFYGREGAEVYDGRTLSREQWLQCREWKTFVAQRRVDLLGVPHPTLDSRGLPEIVEAFPCIGSYLVGDRWAGCYSRIGTRITNSQAQFIPTLVDISGS